MSEEHYGECPKVNMVKPPGLQLSEDLGIPLRNGAVKKERAYFILVSSVYRKILNVIVSLPFRSNILNDFVIL